MFVCPSRAYLLCSTFLLVLQNRYPSRSIPRRPVAIARKPLFACLTPRSADSLRRPAPDQRRKEQQREEKQQISFTTIAERPRLFVLRICRYLWPAPSPTFS